MKKGKFCLLLFFSSLVFYLPSLRLPLFFDDVEVLGDPRIRSFSGIKSISPAERPLRLYTFFVDRKLWGEKYWIWRLENILFHGVNTCILFYLLTLLGIPLRFSFLSSLIFAIHPIHFETLLVISHRKEELLFFFYILSFIFYIKNRPVVSIIFFLFSLLSKEVAISLPFVLLAYEFTHEKKFKKTIPFFVILFVLLLYLPFSPFHLPSYREYSPLKGKHPVFLLLNLPLYAFLYLQKLILPWNTCIDPPFPLLSSPLLIIFWGMWFGVIFLALKAGKKNLFLILFFFITFLFISPLIPAVNPLADRYMYLSSIGIFPLLFLLHRRWKYAIPYILLITIFSCLSMKDWRSQEGIWKRTLRFNPSSYLAHNNLGVIYRDRGELNKAETEFKKAIHSEPRFYAPYVNLGNIYFKKKNYKKAKSLFFKALEKRKEPRIYFNLGLVYLYLGQPDSALYCFETSAKLSPSHFPSFLNAGILYFKRGDIEKAEFYLNRAYRLNPTHPKVKKYLEKIKGGRGTLSQ